MPSSLLLNVADAWKGPWEAEVESIQSNLPSERSELIAREREKRWFFIQPHHIVIIIVVPELGAQPGLG